MKILFVCRANIGRSQIAEAFFNKLSKKHKAISAGAQVDEDNGKVLIEPKVIEPMKEIGFDISKNKQKQVTQKMIKEADKIICMAKKEELPDYLKKSNKLIFWKVENAKGKDYAFHCKIRDQIKKKVEELVKEIG
ncbi:MAG: arsenate reductase ArsC [archaeon]|nr:arsenate reductase ArsC [archaeon]